MVRTTSASARTEGLEWRVEGAQLAIRSANRSSASRVRLDHGCPALIRRQFANAPLAEKAGPGATLNPRLIARRCNETVSIPSGSCTHNR